jgi:rubrerythrin
MPDPEGLRLRAIRYLAMAFKAREDGEADFARRLDERASELMEEAATLANCSSPELEASPEPSGRLHPGFGQAIIPPRPR